MRLKRLWIKEFKNLKDFEITFDQDSPYTVLVGQNGSGKSNLLISRTYLLEGSSKKAQVDWPVFGRGPVDSTTFLN